MSLHDRESQAAETSDYATRVIREQAAYQALIDFFAAVGEKCLEEDRYPTPEEQATFQKLNAAHEARAAQRRESEGFRNRVDQVNGFGKFAGTRIH